MSRNAAPRRFGAAASPRVLGRADALIGSHSSSAALALALPSGPAQWLRLAYEADRSPDAEALTREVFEAEPVGGVAFHVSRYKGRHLRGSSCFCPKKRDHRSGTVFPMGIARLLVASVLVLAPAVAVAHPGGTNSCGCHVESVTNGCHCHESTGACGCDCSPSSCSAGDSFDDCACSGASSEDAPGLAILAAGAVLLLRRRHAR